MAVDKSPTRPTVPEVLPLVNALYATEHGAVGCCAHVVLDDGNDDQECADWCLKWAKEQGHADCIAICEALVQMTTTQRRKLYSLHEVHEWQRHKASMSPNP